MSEREDRDLLRDISEAARRIRVYLGELSYDEFLDDTKTQDSVIRNLEVIGEAARQVSEDLRTRMPTLPWRSMAGMRDRLIHGYFGVNLDVVWRVVSVELAELSAAVDRHLAEEGGERG